MDGVKGKDVLLSVLIGAVDTVIEHQGDATYNSGKTQEIKKSKTGSLGFQTEAGVTISLTFDKVRPLSAGQAELYALSDSGAAATFTYDDPNSGGHKRTGSAKVTIGEEAANTEGLVVVPVTIAFEGDPVTTVNA